MSKSLLLSMISHNLLLELAVTGLLLLGLWLMVFALALKIVCRKIDLRAILPGALAMLIYTLFATLYLSPVVFHALSPLVFMLLVSLFTPKYNLCQLIWLGLMAVISHSFGPVFIHTLCLLHPHNAVFFLHTPPGSIATLAAGMAGPGLLLLFLPKVPQISLRPFLGKKTDIATFDLKLLILPAVVYLGLLAGLTIPVEYPATNPRLIQGNIGFIWAALLIMAATYIYELQRTRKKAVVGAINQKTGRTFVMQVLRRAYLDENERFRALPPELPELGEIFLGAPVKPAEVSEFILDTVAHAQGFLNETFFQDYTLKFQQLTQTEVEVMMMLSHGDNNSKIAFFLKLDEPQVENIITQLLNKFETDDETRLGAYIILLDGVWSKNSQAG